MAADLVELRRLRTKAAWHSFQARGPPFFQIRYQVDGKSRDESTGTKIHREAERMLDFKVYEASAGLIPGTATFEKIMEHFLRDAKGPRTEERRAVGARH